MHAVPLVPFAPELDNYTFDLDASLTSAQTTVEMIRWNKIPLRLT